MSDAFLEEVRAEFPGFQIVAKEGDTFSKVVHTLLRAVTFGTQRHYLSHYHTVIGNTLYVPRSWDALDDVGRVILLRHERVHLRQRRRYTFAGLTFLYLIPIFPLGLAWGRARIEWEAYVETLRATAELEGLDAARAPELRAEIIRRFTGGDYGWMWPFPEQIGRWFDQALEEITREASERESR